MIDREEEDGTYLRQWQLQSRANWILLQDFAGNPNDPAPIVGKNWVARFLRRHPEYKIQTSHPLAADRKKSHDPDKPRKWYERFHNARLQFGIQQNDCYNFNETGF
jgi:Tc5 transposase DNA-binding domain